MNIPFTFRQLQYFVEVAQQGNVSRAAARLHVSQPSVSTAVSQLELLLGESLFNRSAGKGMSLTPAGQLILQEAREILARSANISGIVSGVDPDDEPLSGSLTVACFRDLAPYYMPRLIGAFCARHPNVELSLREVDLKEVGRLLSAGRVELGISYDLGLEHAVRRHPLAALAPYVLLPPEHPLAGEPCIALEALAQEALIMQNLPITQEYFLSLFWSQGLSPSIRFYADSFETQRGLVAQGLGIALSCTRPAVDRSYDGSPIACVPLADEVPAQKIVLAQVEGSEGTRVAKRFVACAAEVFGQG